MKNPSTPLKRHIFKKISKFECDLLKTNEDIDPREIETVMTFVCWGGGGGGVDTIFPL